MVAGNDVEVEGAEDVGGGEGIGFVDDGADRGVFVEDDGANEGCVREVGGAEVYLGCVEGGICEIMFLGRSKKGEVEGRGKKRKGKR